jgi:regulator of protease activity HflC (stomatin/prohibitin superfamily)
MTSAVASAPDPLAPLRTALIDRARAEGARVLAEAYEEERQAMAAARDEAATLLARARADGEAQAAALLALDAAGARQQARSLVLRAEREAYDELRRRACLAVRDLLDGPGRRARLASILRRRLRGPATVRELPDGGLLAETDDGRSINASVGALVDSVIRQYDVERLWTPR